MQLAKPVEGTLTARAGRRIYVVLLAIGTLIVGLGLSVARDLPRPWPAAAMAFAVIGPAAYCLLWLLRLRVELTNYAITYRTLWRTRTFALADLRPPTLETGEDNSPHWRLLSRRLTRPLVRLVLSPYKHPIKHRIDLNLLQLDRVAMQALIEHLGAKDADDDDAGDGD